MLYSDSDGWLRKPVEFLVTVTPHRDGEVRHAARGSGTLCGIPLRETTLARGDFTATDPSACPSCAKLAAETPPEPSIQERLSDRVAGAAAGPLLDELIAALRGGAQVHPWMMGPSGERRRDDVRLHEAVEGGPEADEALKLAGPVETAEVTAEAWRFVAVIPTGARPVIVRRPLRRRAGPDRPGWSFAQAREAARFGAGQTADGVEHALGPGKSLCGIQRSRLTVYLHHYSADDPSACARCAERVAAAPTEPCSQERLHGMVVKAAPGALRDDLADALTRGAEITLWLGSTGANLSRFHAQLDQLDEGRAELAAALQGAGHMSIAHVLHGCWRSTVLLREGEPPLIGRGRTT
ncbi:hypothetical protein [Catellatospora methionotrophica]|uniref:hypothetical protein n=1 Tax=Catellatospora methionotrophica TaxID=121620 RepID=UPI00340E17E0